MSDAMNPASAPGEISASPAPAPAGAPDRVGDSVRAALRQLPGNPLRTFCICLLVWTFVNFEQSMFAYAMPAMSADLGISIGTTGLIISLGFGFAIIGALGAGLLTDRLGRRTMLALCFSVSSSFYALQALAGSAAMLGLTRSMGAGISAGLSPITNSYVAEAAPSRIRALMVGFLQIGFPLGWFIASLIAVPLLASYGWRTIFLTSVLGLPLGWLIHRSIRETVRFEAVRARAINKRPLRAQLGELLEPGARRRTILCVLAFLTKGGAYAGLAFYMPIFLHEVRGYDAATAAHVVGASYGIGILGYLGASIVGEFLLSRKLTIIIWCWLGALALLAFIWLPAAPWQDVIACGAMAIFSFGTSAILTTFVLEQFPTRLRATGASCASASVSLGFAIFPVVVAALVGPVGWQWAITLCVAPLLVLSGVAVLGMRDVPAGADMDDI